MEGSGLVFHVLGPLECRVDGELVPLGGPSQERVLLALALAANQVVPVSRLVAAVWDGEPPATAGHQVRKAVGELRRRIPGGAGVLGTVGAGYRMTIDGEQLDAARFLTLVALGGEDSLQAALDLWRGPIPASSAMLDAVAAELEERRLAATEDLMALRLARGTGSSELIGGLRTLVREYPLRERFRAQLMTALYHCSRRAEALEEYARVRELLSAELGIDPGPELQRVHAEILRDDPVLGGSGPADQAADTGHRSVTVLPADRAVAAAPHPAAAPAAPAPTATPTPPAGRAAAPAPHHPTAQSLAAHRPPPNSLPYDLPDFTGRDAELRTLAEWAAAAGRRLLIVLIEGMGGSGKTALAVRAAHSLSERYPDGRLYVDLGAFTPGHGPVDVRSVLGVLLHTFGVPGNEMPEGLAERTALWRTVTAGRRILVVLDNAGGPDHIRPLLPSSPACLVLATSRVRLAGIDGARTLPLGLLSAADSSALASAIVGPGRLAAEPGAAAELADLCGGLPLALRIAAGRLADRPAWSVRYLVDRLGRDAGRLRELRGGDRGVEASLRLSYEAMTAEAREAFRRLGLFPGHDLDAHAAAALFGTGAETAGELLEHLLDVNLLQQHVADRYTLHDLVREFACSLPSPDPATDRAAVLRLTRHYLSWSMPATATPYHPQQAPSPADQQAGRTPRFDHHGEAVEWFGGHQGPLDAWLVSCDAAVAAVRGTGDQALLHQARLEQSGGYWYAGRYREALAILDELTPAALAEGDTPKLAGLLVRAASCHAVLGDYARSLTLGERAAGLLRTGPAHPPRGLAEALVTISSAHEALGDYEACITAATEAVAVYDRIGRQAHTVTALFNLAHGEAGLGRLAAARDHLLAALDVTGTAARRDLPVVLARLARADFLLGAGDAAGVHAARAAAALTPGASGYERVRTDNVLGAIHHDRGEFAEALRLHRRAHEIALRIEFRRGVAHALQGMAAAEAGLGDTEAAAGHRAEAQAYFDEIGVVRDAAEPLWWC